MRPAPERFRSRTQEIAAINAFDFGVLAFVLVTGLMGLSVGFIKGGLWLGCWVGAIFATLYGYPFIEPTAAAWLKNRDIIANQFLADVAVGAGIFIVSLIFLFMVSSIMTGWVRGSRLNALDRSLGFLAGLVAAVLIVSAAYIPVVASWDKPEEQPEWLRAARLRPVIEWTSGIVQTLLPREITDSLPARANGAGAGPAPWTGDSQSVEALSTPKLPEPNSTKPDGYTARERSDMERLMQTTGER